VENQAGRVLRECRIRRLCQSRGGRSSYPQGAFCIEKCFERGASLASAGVCWMPRSPDTREQCVTGLWLDKTYKAQEKLILLQILFFQYFAEVDQHDILE